MRPYQKITLNRQYDYTSIYDDIGIRVIDYEEGDDLDINNLGYADADIHFNRIGYCYTDITKKIIYLNPKHITVVSEPMHRLVKIYKQGLIREYIDKL